jgi:hypothetical protein
MDRTKVVEAKIALFRELHKLPDDYLLGDEDVNGDLEMLFNMTSDPDIRVLLNKALEEQVR